MASPVHSPAWLLLAAAALLFVSGAGAQHANCSSFQQCTSLPVLGASLYWTYHPGNGTADVAFRAPSSTSGWVAWGINTEGTGMAGSSVFIASHDANGQVTLLETNLGTSGPTSPPGNLKFNVSGTPTVEYAGGAYAIFATIELPNNSTLQNTVWQAGPLSNGQVAPHRTSGPNLQSTLKLDFLSGGNQTATGAPNTKLTSRRNLRGFQG